MVTTKTLDHLREAVRHLAEARSDLDATKKRCGECGGQHWNNRVDGKAFETIEAVREKVKVLIGRLAKQYF